MKFDNSFAIVFLRESKEEQQEEMRDEMQAMLRRYPEETAVGLQRQPLIGETRTVKTISLT